MLEIYHHRCSVVDELASAEEDVALTELIRRETHIGVAFPFAQVAYVTYLCLDERPQVFAELVLKGGVLTKLHVGIIGVGLAVAEVFRDEVVQFLLLVEEVFQLVEVGQVGCLARLLHVGEYPGPSLLLVQVHHQIELILRARLVGGAVGAQELLAQRGAHA